MDFQVLLYHGRRRLGFRKKLIRNWLAVPVDVYEKCLGRAPFFYEEALSRRKFYDEETLD